MSSWLQQLAMQAFINAYMPQAVLVAPLLRAIHVGVMAPQLPRLIAPRLAGGWGALLTAASDRWVRGRRRRGLCPVVARGGFGQRAAGVIPRGGAFMPVPLVRGQVD